MNFARAMITPSMPGTPVAPGFETATGRPLAGPLSEQLQFWMTPEDLLGEQRRVWGEPKNPTCYVTGGNDGVVTEASSVQQTPVNLSARRALESAIVSGKIQIHKNPWPMAAFYMAAPFLTLCAATLYVQTLPTFNGAEFDQNIPFYSGAAALLMLFAPLTLTDLSSLWECFRYIDLRRTMKRTVFCGTKDTMPLWKFLHVSPFDIESATIEDLGIQQEEVNRISSRFMRILNALNYTPVETCDNAKNVKQCVGRRIFTHRMQVVDVSVDDIKMMQNGEITSQNKNRNFDSKKTHRIIVRAQMANPQNRGGQDEFVFEIKTYSPEDFKNKLALLLSGEPLSGIGNVKEKGFFGLLAEQIYRIRHGDFRLIDITEIDRNSYNDNGMGVHFHTLMLSSDLEA